MGTIVTVSYGEFDAGRDDYGVNYMPLGFHVIFSDGGKYCINKDGDGYAISASECEIIKQEKTITEDKRCKVEKYVVGYSWKE